MEDLILFVSFGISILIGWILVDVLFHNEFGIFPKLWRERKNIICRIDLFLAYELDRFDKFLTKIGW